MKKNNGKITEAVFIILLGSLFTVLMGYLYKHSSIFTPTDPGFQFVSYGISGSILTAILHLSDFRSFIAGVLALLLVEFIIFNMTHVGIILAHTLFMAALAGSIFVYHRYYYNKLLKLKFGRFIPLSALLFIADFVLALALGLAVEEANNKEFLIAQAFFGFVIGTGIGLGLELNEPVRKALKVDRRRHKTSDGT
jgi:hypothetical protein